VACNVERELFMWSCSRARVGIDGDVEAENACDKTAAGELVNAIKFVEKADNGANVAPASIVNESTTCSSTPDYRVLVTCL
jgi:hypothetical protein